MQLPIKHNNHYSAYYIQEFLLIPRKVRRKMLFQVKDNTAVVATGKTIQDAVDQAADKGYAELIIMRAPTRKGMENSLHL